MRGKMDCFGITDVGKVRPANEDQFLIADLNKSMLIHQTTLSHEDHTRMFGNSQGKLLVVADGMGGHSEGKRASSIAVQSLSNYILNTMPWFFRLRTDEEADLKDELIAALHQCQQSIEVAAGNHTECRGMGTTLTMAYVLWPRLYVVHAGDSRCYLLRAGRLEQITTDHTIAQQLVQKGALLPEEAAASRFSHMLWNCLGGGTHDLTPDVFKATLQLGDTLLLCTDGLTGRVTDKQITEILTRPLTAEQACQQLVAAANDAGGTDNITVIVAHFRDSHQRAAKAEHATAEAPATGATTVDMKAPNRPAVVREEDLVRV
jgi:serine/threonine protein phosphatase PrpC